MPRAAGKLATPTTAHLHRASVDVAPESADTGDGFLRFMSDIRNVRRLGVKESAIFWSAVLVALVAITLGLRIIERGIPDELWVARVWGLTIPLDWVVCAFLASVVGWIIHALLRQLSASTERAAALQESERHFRIMADNAPVLIWVAEPDGGRAFFNRPWLQFTGQTREQLADEGWLELVHPDDRERSQRAFTDALAGHLEYRLEYRLRRSDGDWRWILEHATPRTNRQGAFGGLVGSCVDITDRRRSEQGLRDSLVREESLLRELDHRVRNNLAGLAGLVRVYQKTGRPSPDVCAALLLRLDAMRTVHDLISRHHGEPVDLADLIGAMTADLVAQGRARSVSAGGPRVLIHPRRISPLVMILQELFTNSTKYGALSVPAGRIDVAWRIDGSHTEFTWNESGGPPPPTHVQQGVGLGLIQGFTAAELAGSCSFQFPPDGFRCSLSIDLARDDVPPGRLPRAPHDEARRAQNGVTDDDHTGSQLTARDSA